MDLPLPRRIWWPWDQPASRVGFFRTFRVSRPALATLYIAVSGPYQAWLDGGKLTIPDDPLPSWRAMHRIGLGLTAATHRLCIEATSGDNGQPFLLACLDWEEEGRLMRVATDATWQMAADPAPGWATESTDLTWRPAWAFDGVWAEPWGMPCNAPDDFCRLSTGWQRYYTERACHVARLYQGLSTAGAGASIAADGSVALRPVPPFPPAPPRLPNQRPRLEWYRTREAHSLTLNNWLDLFEPRAPHVVFDLGSETFARVRVRLRRGGPAILALTTGESLNEVDRYPRRVTDIFQLQDWDAFVTAPTGFRYVKLMALSGGDREVVVEPLEILHIRYDSPLIGHFRCSDQTLNTIWDLSVRTLHLCMQNEIWDGIKRDQLPWMGDLYTEALAVYYLFAEARLVRRTLAVLAEIGPGPERALEAQRYPGLKAIWRSTNGDINGIPSYTMWWVVGLADYLRFTGDTSLVVEVADELEAALGQIARGVGSDGLWRPSDGWDYVDWAPLPAAERQTFCHLLATWAIRLGAGLLETLGRPVERWLACAERMAASARQAWWHATGSFGLSHHVNAMAIRSGILTDAEAATLFARTLEPDPPLRMTYWHRHGDLDAAARVGQITWGLEYIRRHWGQALQAGMTTLWEAFDPAWLGNDPHAVSVIGAEHARYGGYETSLCHGWSAGPAAWLPAAVLGVQPAAAGFAAVTFAPCLGDLSWAEGTIPTPRGPIQVALRRIATGQQEAHITIPQGIDLRLPERPAQSWQIRVSSS